jgi:hypothetical protein
MRRLNWLLTVVLMFCTATAGAADKIVGVIMSGNIGYYQEVHKAFVGTLAKEGLTTVRSTRCSKCLRPIRCPGRTQHVSWWWQT